ncbi:hypothetical protein DFH11DRAFT_853462 [Phellopilus nigrolimitatus]|nr:hypothetical protein DFH11DRAFT_853462 [Phellopilus nigrolimitatus]
MAHQMTNIAPKTSVARPQLPYTHANPFLAIAATVKAPAVKYQVITREGQEIVVSCRITDLGDTGWLIACYAFRLGESRSKRLAMATPLFFAGLTPAPSASRRCSAPAFPSATEEAEKIEASWVKSNFDSYGANGGPGRDNLRLAGTWVRPEIAATIAPMYSLDHVISPLVNAEPQPGQQYRRSTKPASPQVNGNASPTKATTNPRFEVTAPPPLFAPPSPTLAAGPGPTKRRKESLPVTTSPTKPPAETLPPPRRSGRTVSPAPMPPAVSQQTAPATRASRAKTAKPSRASTNLGTAGKPSSRMTPVESDHARHDDDGDDDDVDNDIAEVPGPNMHEDFEEQMNLIKKLKAERAAKEVATTEISSQASAVPLQQLDSQSSKRSREEDDEQPMKLNIREPDAQSAVVTRKIKSNKRLSLEPQQKSAAWGALWFATGLAIAATIPSFFV